jgi:hypothetical protein
MIITQHIRSYSNTLTHEYDGFFIVILPFPRQSKVIHAVQRVWMLLAKHLLSRLHHSHVQPFGLCQGFTGAVAHRHIPPYLSYGSRDGNGDWENWSSNSVQDWTRGQWKLLEERHTTPHFTRALSRLLPHYHRDGNMGPSDASRLESRAKPWVLYL